MNRVWTCLFVAALMLVSSAMADDHTEPGHGSDHGDGASMVEGAGAGADHGHDEAGTPPLLQFDLGSAICNLLIFVGVFAILAKFVWPPILEGLRAREEKIHGDLVRAEQANEDAKAMLAEYQAKLGDAQTEVQSMLAASRKDAEASAARIAEQAKQDADRQRERAMSDIEAAKKMALADLANQTSAMAIGVASQVVGRELRAEDHAELIRSSLDRLPSQN